MGVPCIVNADADQGIFRLNSSQLQTVFDDACASVLHMQHAPVNVQEWIPDMVWLNVVALSSMTALHDIPDSVFRNDGLWRQWYDAEAPETANVPDYEDRLSKFERMCVVKV
jgi:hypothetical protein